jgi:hypothetical protein
MYSELKESIGIAYERFLMRDLTYVFSGFILLNCFTFAYYGSFKPNFYFLPYISETCNICMFLLFLIISYFVGFIAKEGLQHIKINNNPVFFSTLPKYPYPFNQDSESGKGSLIMKSIINKKYGIGTTLELERRIYIFHIGASIGSTSFLGSILLIIAIIPHKLLGLDYNYDIYFLLIGILVLSFIVCKIENTWMLQQYENQLKRLVSDLLKDKEWIKKNSPTLVPFIK